MSDNFRQRVPPRLPAATTPSLPLTQLWERLGLASRQELLPSAQSIGGLASSTSDR